MSDASSWLARCRPDDLGPGCARERVPSASPFPPGRPVGGARSPGHRRSVSCGPAFSRGDHPLPPADGPLADSADPTAGRSAHERGRHMIRWRRRPSTPIVMSTATFSSNCTAEPQASVQLAYAADRAMSAAAGMVVTGVETPVRALARDSVNETTPTIPARTATTAENRFGLSIRLDTGRTPSENYLGV